DLANEGITLRFILQLCLAGLAMNHFPCQISFGVHQNYRFISI
ncbi:hypothetical protein EC971742_1289, partial [Escherichia coli 97.1742]